MTYHVAMPTMLPLNCIQLSYQLTHYLISIVKHDLVKFEHFTILAKSIPLNSLWKGLLKIRIMSLEEMVLF